MLDIKFHFSFCSNLLLFVAWEFDKLRRIQIIFIFAFFRWNHFSLGNNNACFLKKSLTFIKQFVLGLFSSWEVQIYRLFGKPITFCKRADSCNIRYQLLSTKIQLNSRVILSWLEYFEKVTQSGQRCLEKYKTKILIILGFHFFREWLMFYSRGVLLSP